MTIRSVTTASREIPGLILTVSIENWNPQHPLQVSKAEALTALQGLVDDLALQWGEDTPTYE